MAYNLITDLYAAHLTSAVEPEIDDVCEALAGMIFATLTPLPLRRPLKGVSSTAVVTPPDLPWAVVLPNGQNREEKLDQINVAFWHGLDLMFLFGQPMPADTQVKANLDYLLATRLALSVNQHLDVGVRRIGWLGWDWRPFEYAGKEWAGIIIHLEAETQYGMRAGW
jgi:hypothetical protein